jgi:H+/Cl- antiporter ClcA
MVIIDLKTLIMGVAMGFLAFLVIGGISGASAWIFYPGKSNGPGLRKLLLAAFLGFIAALASSYLGQYFGLFQSGQMLEWISAIFASCLVGCIFTALAK